MENEQDVCLSRVVDPETVRKNARLQFEQATGMPLNAAALFMIDKDCGRSPLFGVNLNKLPMIEIQADNNIRIPSVLVELTDRIKDSIGTQGLFRLAGSLERQNKIKERLENGNRLTDDDCGIDCACLFKRFLRELPNKLIPPGLNAEFLRLSGMDDIGKVPLIMQLILCLSPESISTLRYVLRFCLEVTANCDNNKMDTKNMATLLMPNLLMDHSDGFSKEGVELLNAEIAFVKILLENADLIGMVPPRLLIPVPAAPELPPNESKERKKSFGETVCDKLKSVKRKVSGSGGGNSSKSKKKSESDGLPDVCKPVSKPKFGLFRSRKSSNRPQEVSNETEPVFASPSIFDGAPVRRPSTHGAGPSQE